MKKNQKFKGGCSCGNIKFKILSIQQLNVTKKHFQIPKEILQKLSDPFLIISVSRGFFVENKTLFQKKYCQEWTTLHCLRCGCSNFAYCSAIKDTYLVDSQFCDFSNANQKVFKNYGVGKIFPTKSRLLNKSPKERRKMIKPKTSEKKFTNLEDLELSSFQKSSQNKHRARSRTKKKKKRKKKTKLINSSSDLSLLTKKISKSKIQTNNKSKSKSKSKNKDKHKLCHKDIFKIQKKQSKGGLIDPIFQYQNRQSSQESYDSNEQNQKLNDEERFLKIFRKISETGTLKKKFEDQEFEIENDTEDENDNEIGNHFSPFDPFLINNNPENVAKSCPIPIGLNLNSETQSSNTSDQDLESLFFIQPHKYIESTQTKTERELDHAFNVPLKRVPSWKILNFQNSSFPTQDIEN
ncbi:hypothetical protein M0812_23691 [Anaeramoeba flamelloides]|uniref:Uncharacterized protein n=1 Tax=Anaeramoeba flamelloides TaxID=1746091 RepID=A0AAV7YRV4_9EUKA|nr:hypothetical protein M0812_23691 [Anaeramoeba flamelloides]